MSFDVINGIVQVERLRRQHERLVELQLQKQGMYSVKLGSGENRRKILRYKVIIEGFSISSQKFTNSMKHAQNRIIKSLYQWTGNCEGPLGVRVKQPPHQWLSQEQG